jgi:UDP-GlcNAc:undecaprenyl-phosphate GlcNAc-1-phosphate transferase
MDQNIILTIIAFFASVLCGFFIIPQILNFCKRKRLYDIPNERKVHKHAIPRLGGISFIPSMLIAFFLALWIITVKDGDVLTLSLWSVYFFIGLMMIYVVGLIDDIVGLSPTTKFIVQVLAACVLPASGLYFNNLYGFCGITDIPIYLGWPLTVFIVVFIVNAMNLIDGIDGLSGGLSILALGGFMYSFAKEGLWIYVILIAGLMGVLVPFLYFNFFGSSENNRKIFMGDAGSLSLGFILAFLCVKFAMDNQAVMPYRRNSLLLSYTMLIVPTFDVVRVTLYRLRHRKPLFAADKNHIHHKLMKIGLSQHQTLFVILVLAFGYILLNHFLAKDCFLTFIVFLDVIMWIAFHLVLDYLIKRKQISDSKA